jgi:cell division protein FtsN
MGRRHLLFILITLFFCSYSYAQSVDSSAVILDSKDTIKTKNDSRSLINPRNLEIKQKNYWEDYAKKTKKSQSVSNEEELYKPILSIGIGTLSFFGDLGDTVPGKDRINRAPFQGGFSYTLRLVNPINDYLDVAFYAMLGRTSVNQTTESPLYPTPNGFLFRSSIKSGGITFNYNFNQLLKKGHIVEPYIHLGLESIEYNSEVDTDPNDASSNYDSDVSIFSDEQPKNKYAFGLPLEIGAHVHIGNKIKFRVGSAIHFTSTDYMDGINNSGNFPLGFGKDNLLFTHIAVAYDFNAKKEEPPLDPIFDEISMNLLLQDTIDSDGDSIVDHIDFCAKTPPNTPVDQFGCPLDDDIDGVMNSKDMELLTFEGAIVNENGVTMTEDDFMLAFKKYRDSTGEYSEWDTIYNKSYAGPLRSKLTIDEIINANSAKEPVEKQEKELFIVIGSDVQGVSSEKLWEKLADRDFQVKESGDSIMYVLGGYDQNELSAKIKELEENNVNVQGIVEISSDDEITTLEKEEVDQIMNASVSTPNNSAKKKSSDEFVPVIEPNDNLPTFRVQIGAFNRKIKKSIFKDIPNLVGIKGDDGLYRFFSGSYSDKSKAASHKVDLTLTGYNDAFIVAFQNGKRITLKEAGFEVKKDFSENLELSSTPSENPIDSEMVRFKIQVGAFKEKVPDVILDNFKKLGNVKAITNTGQGYTKYYMGDFMDYSNVLKFRKKLVANGLIDCFIVGEFKNNIITSKEARDLLGQ